MTPEVGALLGLKVERITPNDLIRAMLRAPVDLFWNGGIGTYVKASHESHEQASDKANDALRVDASELRCRVVRLDGVSRFCLPSCACSLGWCAWRD